MQTRSNDIHYLIYKQLADILKQKGLNLDIDVIEKICRTEMAFTAAVMESGSFDSVRLKYLGLFGVKRFREMYIQEEYLTTEELQKRDKLTRLEFVNLLKQKLENYHKKYKPNDDRETPVAQYYLDGQLKKEYKTIKEAAIDTNILYVCISQCCKKNLRDNGKTYTAKGFIWKFTNEQKEKS
jgi:hypothetical protein